MHNDRIANALPLDDELVEGANPFLATAADSPFAVAAKPATAADDAPEGSYEYQVLKTAPAVPADEIETNSDAVAVEIRWGRNVLHVSHLEANGSFYLGETEDAATCDYFIPGNKLGASRAPLVREGRVVLLPGAVGKVTRVGGGVQTVADAAAAATPCTELAGACELPLENGTEVVLELGDMTFVVRGEKRAKKAAAAFTAAALGGTALAYVVGSFVGHAGLLAAMAAFTPPLGATQDDGITDDQRYFISQHLDDSAQAEKDTPEDERLASDDEPGSDGGTGTRAKNEEGVMGDQTSKEVGKRWAVQGDPENTDPHVARQRALADAKDFGIIGLINAGTGAIDSPTAPFGRDEAWGVDPISANGNMWGDQIGNAHGAGGLGLTGIGEGGGGFGEGIGLGSIGTIGHGAGVGDGQGFGPVGGNSWGRIGPAHETRSPRIRMTNTEVSGRIPPEVIQRIVRNNYGRFRACYESALRGNPNLQGRVAVSFLIGRDGTVKTASGGGDIPDSGVISCVTQAFYGLSFPAPEGGTVRVTYPIVLTPTS
ncbi:MAG TPA: AgmX/PglI C-terminal domain-containing protein [Polyangiaceae bacterium]|nr:AgmX/PglI C-terminal domain-containing protein [Polyangiaceae bacterium]